MTTLARWSIAVTSTAAAFASAAFVSAYSAIERNDAVWNHMTLPDATELLARLAPFGIGVAALMALGSTVAASRRSDTGTVVGASIAWLFAFAWVLACLYVWRTPHMLIGGTVSR